jgi:hypothetical protein
MYTVYRTFREETGQNLTLLCESPVDLKGKSWDVLEEICVPTVKPPQPTVTCSTANTTAVSTSQSDQFNSTTVQQDVPVQESSPDAAHLLSPSSFHPPSTFVVIIVASLTVAMIIFGFVVNRVASQLRRTNRQLNRLWWEDVVARKELMSD